LGSGGCPVDQALTFIRTSSGADRTDQQTGRIGAVILDHHVRWAKRQQACIRCIIGIGNFFGDIARCRHTLTQGVHGISQRRLVILHPGQGKCQQWWRKFFIAFVGQVIPGNIQPVGVTASILIGEYIVVPDDGGPINFCASGAGQEKAAEDKQLNNTHGLPSLMPEKILAYYRPYCSGYSTVLIRTRIVLVVEINHSISWPTDNPSSALPIGESTEILSAQPSVSFGYTSV